MGNKLENIRNIAVLGHGGDGKTTLCEALLYDAKSTDRLGKVDDGNSVMDYDEHEIAKKISIQLSAAYANWKGVKINLLDVPGFFDFAGEMEEALSAADGAIVVANANGNVSVGAEKAIAECAKKKIPLIIFINAIDKENSDYISTLNAYLDAFPSKIAPIQIPDVKNGKFDGYVSVSNGKFYGFDNGGRVEKEMPASLKGEYDRVRGVLLEKAAESDEELLDKFFSEGELTEEEIVRGLKKGITACSTYPVLAGSALTNKGIYNLLDEIVNYMPSPVDAEKKTVKTLDGKDVTLDYDENKPVVLQVFKTVADAFVGKLNLVKVFSGKLKSGVTLYNTTADGKERINQIYILKGKKQESVDELCAGDIGAISKLTNTNTGDTLCDEQLKVKFAPIDFPEPVLAMAVTAAKQGEEDKVFSGLYKLEEEDPSFKVEKNAETNEMLIDGQGETQLDIISRKLKGKFGVTAVLTEPRIAFKETIKGKMEAEGKHKKQSGGAGQFGVANIRFEQGAADGVFEFVDAVVGGAVPRQFIPAVEKGLREAVKAGVLAGYPMVNLKCTLFDGKYHPVDSKEIAFVSAARLAYEEAIPKAKPILLEPIMEVKVVVPESYMGDILGDMNKRRGRILGMDLVDGKQEISAEVPQSEIAKYATDLRSMTQGRGKFTKKFIRYEEVPATAQDKIIKDAKDRAAKENK